jgi:hypothetical protein
MEDDAEAERRAESLLESSPKSRCEAGITIFLSRPAREVYIGSCPYFGIILKFDN